MTNGLRADTFGSGANQFTMDFVQVSNTGNENDSTGYGSVSYEYRMGKYEVSQDMINKASASGVPGMPGGTWVGNQPSSAITWYQAAAFVNWLNTSSGYHAAYNLTWNRWTASWEMSLWYPNQAWQMDGENLYRYIDAYYFLPNENEWYKAAYHKNDGVTSNYWAYPTGSNSAPTKVESGTGAGTAVYNGLEDPYIPEPAAVDNAGGLSPYGTMGQGGNVWEWMESAFNGTNNSTSADRTRRGGYWMESDGLLSSSHREDRTPEDENPYTGFRVASVPEPTTGVLLVLAGGGWLLWRRKHKHGS